MSASIESFSEYCKAVQRKALIELEEVEMSLDRDEIEMEDHEVISKTADEALNACHFLMYNQRAIINYTNNGFYGEGYERYIQHVEVEDNDPNEMKRLLATAALYNDLKDVLEEIFDCRNNLGNAMMLVDDMLYSPGVECEYIYEKTTTGSEFTFTLKHLGENEWQVFDPNGDSFEVISPDVHVADSDREIPVKAINIWLNNICARRFNELTKE